MSSRTWHCSWRRRTSWSRLSKTFSEINPLPRNSFSSSVSCLRQLASATRSRSGPINSGYCCSRCFIFFSEFSFQILYRLIISPTISDF